jgi:hypothetical protein
MKITETDALTGETVERQPTEEEITQFEIDQAIKAEAATAAALKAEAKAGLLERLGITSEEAELLLA